MVIPNGITSLLQAKLYDIAFMIAIATGNISLMLDSPETYPQIAYMTQTDFSRFICLFRFWARFVRPPRQTGESPCRQASPVQLVFGRGQQEPAHTRA